MGTAHGTRWNSKDNYFFKIIKSQLFTIEIAKVTKIVGIEPTTFNSDALPIELKSSRNAGNDPTSFTIDALPLS